METDKDIHMEKLLKFAIIAWNPIGAVEKKYAEGTLNLSSVVGPFLAVVVGCNLLVLGAQKFFFESVGYAIGTQIQIDHPLISNDFAQQFLSTIGVIVPVLAVSVLPRSIFGSVGKNATLSALFVVIAGWAFYSAVLGVPQYFISGVLVMSDPEFGINISVILAIIVSVIVVVLSLTFWFRVLLAKLRLSGGSVAAITVSYVIGLTVLILLLWPVIN